MTAFQTKRAYIIAILATIADGTVVLLVLNSPATIDPSFPAFAAGIWGSWAMGVLVTLFLLVFAGAEIHRQRVFAGAYIRNQSLVFAAMGSLGSTLFATAVIIFLFFES